MEGCIFKAITNAIYIPANTYNAFHNNCSTIIESSHNLFEIGIKFLYGIFK